MEDEDGRGRMRMRSGGGKRSAGWGRMVTGKER